MEDMIRKEVTIEVLSRTEKGGRIRINTASFDRDEDRVFPSGAQVENYLANPVVQWGHNYKDPWATIGRTLTMDLAGDAIDVDFEFRPAFSAYDPQHIIIGLWEGGWVRTASIGFKPLTYKQNGSGFDFTSWELLEWSLVPIPANQDALRLAVKGMEPQLLTEQDLLAASPTSLVVVDPDGASVPLADYIQGLAKEQDASIAIETEVKEISLDRLVDEVCTAVYRALWRDQDYDGVRRCIVAVYATHAIVAVGVAYYRADYTISDMGAIIVAPRDTWPEVEQSWAELSVTLETIGRSWSQKAGARHSAKDIEAIQGIHDMAVGLGAACQAGNAGEDMEAEAAKGVVPGEAEDQTDQIDLTGLKAAIGNLNALVRKEK